MADVPTTDVVVIGGGPAGSTMASFLSKKGHSVTVFERDRFPREHVGESMLPFCYHVFKELGVLEDMKARWVRKPGVRFIDVDGITNTAWCFWHHIEDESSLSFQVIRSEFDDELLKNSISLGTTVHYETKVTNVELDDDGATVFATGPDGEQIELRTRFVVDASGRDTFMSNRLGTKVAHKELERTALSCSYWKGAKFVDTLEEGLIQIVYLGGEKQGWIWCIPLGNDRVSVGVVVNSSYYRAQRKELLAEGHEDWKMALYLKEIAAAPYTKEILDGATMERNLMVNGDYSYLCKQKWGDRFALVGDASAFIDPIFSSGVFMAMSSAQILSEVVSKRLNDGVEATEPDFVDAYDRVVSAYDVIDRLDPPVLHAGGDQLRPVGVGVRRLPRLRALPERHRRLPLPHRGRLLRGGQQVPRLHRDVARTEDVRRVQEPGHRPADAVGDHLRDRPRRGLPPRSARARAAARRPAPLDRKPWSGGSELTPPNFERFTSNTDEKCSRFVGGLVGRRESAAVAVVPSGDRVTARSA